MLTQAELMNFAGDVLLSPSCQGIDFRVLGAEINHHAYRTVLFAILQDRIHLVQSAQPLTTAGPGTRAEYDYTSNTLTVGPDCKPKDIKWQMHLVHEATHAAFDALYKGRTLRTELNEAIAYLADATYYGYLPPSLKMSINSKSNAPFYVAVNLVSPANGSPGLGYTIKRGDLVDIKTLQPIIDAVIRLPGYANELKQNPTITFDGIPPAP
jgi:hypothetical protein